MDQVNAEWENQRRKQHEWNKRHSSRRGEYKDWTHGDKADEEKWDEGVWTDFGNKTWSPEWQRLGWTDWTHSSSWGSAHWTDQWDSSTWRDHHPRGSFPDRNYEHS